MNKRKRIDAAIGFKDIDRIPWTMYKSMASWGEAEFEFRTAGLTAIYQNFPVANTALPEVELLENHTYSVSNKKGLSGRNIITRSFKTPVGEILVKHGFFNYSIPGPGDFIGRYTSNIDQEVLSWYVKHPFKKESDYEVLEFIYKNIKYSDTNEEFLYTDKIIGEEGCIMPNAGKSPFSIILNELMGVENCYLELHNNPKKFHSLYKVLYERTIEKYQMAADSPATIIHLPENLTAITVPPTIFKEYYMPFYKEIAEIVHKKGKFIAAHFDGNLKPLLELIADTEIDIIEAFTPLPMGDITVKEAREAWPDKVLWLSFPGTLIASYTINRIEGYTTEMLNSISPAKGFMIGCTENFPIAKWEMFRGVKAAINKFGKVEN